MDSFLSNLYRENMEKKAGVELKEFYDSLSVEQLEQVLGLTKVAVEGPTTPELPDGGPVKKYLDATEKAVAKKTTPPELPTESATPSLNNTAIESGKQLLQSSTGKPEPTTPFVTREIKTTGDPRVGSRDVEPTTVFDRLQSGPQDNKTAAAKLRKQLGKAKNSTVFDQLEGKVAADLTLKKRESLPSSKFAIPAAKAKKIGVAHEIVGESKGKYPINDAVHARNALARVAQHGTPAEKAIVQRKVHAKFPGIGEKSAEAVACADQVGRMMAKTATLPLPVNANLIAGLLAAQMPITGTVSGALDAPPGERGRGAAQGLMTGLGGDVGALGGGVGGYQLAKHLGGGPRAKLLAMLGGGALGAFGGAAGGQALGKKIAPFRSSPEEVAMYRAGGPFEDEPEGKTAEKRAELLITALRATKDAPDYVKHAAAKYVGERL